MNCDIFKKRREGLFSRMQDDSVVLLANPPLQTRNADAHYPYRPCSDFYYLTGIIEDETVAVLCKKGGKEEYFLFMQEQDAILDQFMGKRIGLEGALSLCGADEAFYLDQFQTQLPELLKSSNIIYLAMGRHPDIEDALSQYMENGRLHGRKGEMTPQQIINLDTILHQMRLLKDPTELENMHNAIAAAAAGHIRVMQQVAPGKMEYELEAEFMHEIMRRGCRHTAYESIVASGANACVLHYVKNNCKCRDGQMLLIDAGAEYQYYASDITRTYPVNGTFSARQQAIYEAVLNTQQAVIEKIKPGVTWDVLQETSVDAISQSLLDNGLVVGSLDEVKAEKLYKDFYMHSIGHWLGLDVHDVGSYREQGGWQTLQPGMVFTIEPGIYISPENDKVESSWHGIGVRIEDNILVTENGAEVLTSQVPSSISDLEALMNE